MFGTGGLELNVPASVSPGSREAGVVTVHFVDVGHGSAVLIESSTANVLIDGGSAMMATHTVEYLQRQGVKRLDAVVASTDRDGYAGGLARVLEDIPVSLYRDPDLVSDDSILLELQQLAARRNIIYRRLVSGQEVFLGEYEQLRLEVLWPPQDLSAGVDDACVSCRGTAVLLLSVGRVRFLFPSALGQETERRVLRSGTKLESTFLHLADQGARTSSCGMFLDEVDPAIAVASCGVYNERAVPHTEVLERLRNRQIKLYRTDRHGTVRVGTDGRLWWITKERKSTVHAVNE